MVHYVAVGCSSDTRGKDKVSFFRLPKGGNLKKIWLQKIKRENIPKEKKHTSIPFTFRRRMF